MMPRDLVEQLENRGYRVVMAVDVGMTGKTDPEHLQYATEQHLVMVTFDRPFAGLTSRRADHGGLICLTLERQDDMGGIVRLLSQFGEQYTPESVIGRVFWIK